MKQKINIELEIDDGVNPSEGEGVFERALTILRTEEAAQRKALSEWAAGYIEGNHKLLASVETSWNVCFRDVVGSCMEHLLANKVDPVMQVEYSVLPERKSVKDFDMFAYAPNNRHFLVSDNITVVGDRRQYNVGSTHKLIINGGLDVRVDARVDIGWRNLRYPHDTQCLFSGVNQNHNPEVGMKEYIPVSDHGAVLEVHVYRQGLGQGKFTVTQNAKQSLAAFQIADLLKDLSRLLNIAGFKNHI